MRNIDRVGFMDSPNRLNVGITRARELLIVFGHREFYKTASKNGKKCRFLNQLAAQAHPIS
jgi:superfamily I DNA and/or RNA helicase